MYSASSLVLLLSSEREKTSLVCVCTKQNNRALLRHWPRDKSFRRVYYSNAWLNFFLGFQNYSKETIQKPGAPPPHTTLQRHTKANRNVFIPRYRLNGFFSSFFVLWYLFSSSLRRRFYYPFGKPESQQQWDTIVKTITDYFVSLPNSHASKHHFGQIAKVKKQPSPLLLLHTSRVRLYCTMDIPYCSIFYSCVTARFIGNTLCTLPAAVT